MPRLLTVLPIFLAVAATAAPAASQAPSGHIHLDQIGFYPGAPKVAVVEGGAAAGGRFFVTTPALEDTVLSGRLSDARAGQFEGEDSTRVADFSALSAPGRYVVLVPGVGYSYLFTVAPRVHEDLARGVLKAFYFQRASTGIESVYAGEWSRPAGHPDDRVLIHPSAATPARPAGTVVSAPGGWYDAGDYNKYVVNSGISTATLLSLYEDFPAYAAALAPGIPEGRNALPDVLDEALWNLRWMLAMQDPTDGGVYHKLTEATFSGFVMPAEVRAPRYLVQKSTAAALDFAAVMAQASRVLRRFDASVPGLADSTLAAAERAWRWARLHPDSLYDQNRLNREFDPDVTTGAYGDRDVGDEFVWAASELYATTGRDSFFTALPLLPDSATPVPSWGQVRTLGYYSLLRNADRLTERSRPTVAALRRLIAQQADSLLAIAATHNWRAPMGERRDFVWGSNAVAANQGVLLVQAYRATGDAKYLRGALANLDYLLGRNGTGYSYVTGFGVRTPLHPHHRLSEADGVPAPIPGWLVGGPNPGQQDHCPSNVPDSPADRAYVDDVCAYAANEIAINWNAPIVYLAAAMEALQYDIGLSPPDSR
jgi:endoglucanase